MVCLSIAEGQAQKGAVTLRVAAPCEDWLLG